MHYLCTMSDFPWHTYLPKNRTSFMDVPLVKNKYASLWLFFLYYAVFLKVDFPKNAYSVAVFFSVMIRLKPFQWKIVITYLYSIRNTYVLELWVGLNSIPQKLLTSCFHYFVYTKRKCDATFLSSLIIAKKKLEIIVIENVKNHCWKRYFSWLRFVSIVNFFTVIQQWF